MDCVVSVEWDNHGKTLFNVYMPYENGTSLYDYNGVWNVILSKCKELDCSKFITGGDLTTSLYRDNSILIHKISDRSKSM